MQEYSVSICDSYLIWDYERGEVICSSTGEVVDKIYDYTPHPLHEKIEVIEQRQKLVRTRPKRNPVEKKYRKHLLFYNKASRIIESKPWLTVDYDKLFKIGRFIKTLSSHSTNKALRNIEEKGIRRDLDKVIEIIKEVEPAAVSRTERAKYALAYIVLKLALTSNPPEVAEVTRLFNISTTTYRRLERLAKRIIAGIRREKLVIDVPAITKR